MTGNDQYKRTQRARSGRWAIGKTSAHGYRVVNLNNGGHTYTVAHTGGEWKCDCNDYTQRRGRCKHIGAVRLSLESEPLSDQPHHSQEVKPMSPEQGPNWDEIKRQLAAPFHSYYVGWKAQATNHDKTRALAVAYIDARTVMDRLDQVVGPGHWSDTYRLVSAGDGEFAVECTLTLFGVHKSDVGTAEEDEDGRQASLSKSAYSDALKRAAVKWGIGRYLYRLAKQWVGYDAARKQLTEIPALPAWALPGGTGTTNAAQARHLSGDNGRGNGKTAQVATTSTGDEHSVELEQARATVLPFGTREHPEWKGKPLGELAALNADLIPWLAESFGPTSEGGRAVQQAAQVMVHHLARAA